LYTILHIENSDFFKKIFEDIFRKKNINYIFVKTVEDAYKVLDSKKINLILTAIEIPKSNINHFLEELNSNIKYAEIPIFVISGKEELDTRKEVFSFGIVDYILKKTSIFDIVKIIESFINEEEFIKSLKKFKIAVLDDSEVELNIIKDIFKDKKIWNVDYYTKGKELISSSEGYDLYLIDLILQDCSGEEVILNLREKNEKSIIITVSSVTNEKTISHILSIGADDYIIKPYVSDIFMARIRSRVRNYLMIKELIEKLSLNSKEM